MIFLLRV